MTYKFRYPLVALIVICLVLVTFAGFYVAKAGSSFFIQANNIVCGNFTATTTPTFMTAGTATTTYTFDTSCATAGSVDSAVFVAQLTGSSTNTVINYTMEYSQDNLDWYGDDYKFPSASTTESIIPINNTRVFALTFASTSPGGVGGAGTGRIQRLVDVVTPTKYIRAVITIPSGSTNGAVWGQFVAKRQAQ